jgi:hypothetical protein
MNNTALQIREADSAAMMPAMSIQDAVDRHQMVVQFVGAMLKSDIDFGVIPGTNKPTLLKPGAEKLLTFFGLTKRFTVLEKVEDWMGADHGGSFFYYMYRCALYNGDRLIAESDGSCNSHESKYRWRKAERECPTCGKAAIIKGRDEYGGGWVCFKKKDGCGAKFRDGDASIEGQQVGRVENPDMADLVNTIQKMAQKRALIAATLLAVNASEFFTQDIEDMVIEAEFVEVKPALTKAEPKQTKAPEPIKQAPAVDTPTVTATEFWKSVRKWGVPEKESSDYAEAAAKREITWAEALNTLREMYG